MARKRIYCDRAELVLTVLLKNKAEIVNLVADQLVNIRFAPCKEWSFFRRVESEKIIITTKNRRDPFIYKKREEKKFFEEYKRELAEFIKNNRITFYNDLDAKDN